MMRIGIVLLAMVVASGWAMKGDEKQNAQVQAGAKPCQIEELERPYVLLSKERLEALRKEAAPGGAKHEVYAQGVGANVALWAPRQITVPERAGHFHFYFCKDGTQLELPKDQLFTTTGTYTCPACGAKYSGEPYESAHRNMEHGWLISACRDLAIAAAVENNQAYAQKAAEILVKYADAYPGRHTKSAGPDAGGIYWQSLDEAMYIIPLAQAYDLIYDRGVLSDAQKQHIERDLFWECAEGLIKMGARTNWGSWHLSAVGVIGLATKHQRYIDYAVKSFRAQMDDELGKDGLWPESVHCYHFFPLGGFIYLAEAAANAGIDLYHYKGKKGVGLEEMFTAPIDYMYPDLRVPAINDGWFQAFLPAEQYVAAYHRFHLPQFAWALERCKVMGKEQEKGWTVPARLWTLAVGEQIPDRVSQPAFRSINFPVLGIAMLRHGPSDIDKDTMLSFDYGRHLGHGQLDKMGITLWANNRLICADYGTPGYGSAILPYYTGTAGHNTVMVDGKDQKQTTDSKLLLFADTPQLKVACAATDQAYPGIDWRRTVALADDYALVVDTLTSQTEHDYDWLLHAEGDYAVVRAAKAEAKAGGYSNKYVTDVAAYAPENGAVYAARWQDNDATGLALQALCTSATQIYVAKTPAETGTRRVPLTVLRQHGKSVRFVALLRPYKDAKQAGESYELVEGEDGRIFVKHAGATDTFDFGAKAFIWERKSPGQTMTTVSPWLQ